MRVHTLGNIVTGQERPTGGGGGEEGWRGAKNERRLQRRCLTFPPLYWFVAVAIAVRQRHGPTTELIGWQKEGGVKGVKAECGQKARRGAGEVHPHQHQGQRPSRVTSEVTERHRPLRKRVRRAETSIHQVTRGKQEEG